MRAFNKGKVIRGGFGSTFRLSAVSAQAGLSAARLPERGQVLAQAGLSAKAQAERIVCHENRQKAGGNRQ